MQKVSGNYERLRNSQSKEYEHRVVIDWVGTFEESFPLFSVNTDINLFQGAPKIGKAVAGEIDLSMMSPNVAIPTRACVRPYVRAYGIVDKSSAATVIDEQIVCQDSNYSSGVITINTPVTVSGENVIFPVDGEEYIESEWIPQGVFFIDTREVTANNNNVNVLTIHGFDAMLKAEQDYASNDVVGDNYDTAYVRAIASAIGVEVDDRTWVIMGTGYIIPFPLGYSMREILGYIAASYAGCFVITDEGKLRLISLPDIPSETNLLIDQIGDVILFGGDSILI